MFALLVSIDYEGSDLVGLYSSVDAAVAAAQRYMEEDKFWGDEIEVLSMEVDAPAVHRSGRIEWSHRR